MEAYGGVWRVETMTLEEYRQRFTATDATAPESADAPSDKE